jgi:hypothetical protein
VSWPGLDHFQPPRLAPVAPIVSKQRRQVDGLAGRHPRRQDRPRQHEVDDTCSLFLRSLVKVTMLTASVRMRGELGVLDGSDDN